MNYVYAELMSAEVQELWTRLKGAARECAAQGRDLSVRDAEALVLKTAHALGMLELPPPQAIAFYTSEVLSLVATERRRPGWTP